MEGILQMQSSTLISMPVIIQINNNVRIQDFSLMNNMTEYILQIHYYNLSYQVCHFNIISGYVCILKSPIQFEE